MLRTIHPPIMTRVEPKDEMRLIRAKGKRLVAMTLSRVIFVNSPPRLDDSSRPLAQLISIPITGYYQHSE